MSKRYSIAEARNHLPAIVHDAERGKPIHLTRRGKPVAVLLSIDASSGCRRADRFSGAPSKRSARAGISPISTSTRSSPACAIALPVAG
jgi:prevent-host-death family protein